MARAWVCVLLTTKSQPKSQLFILVSSKIQNCKSSCHHLWLSQESIQQVHAKSGLWQELMRLSMCACVCVCVCGGGGGEGGWELLV